MTSPTEWPHRLLVADRVTGEPVTGEPVAEHEVAEAEVADQAAVDAAGRARPALGYAGVLALPFGGAGDSGLGRMHGARHGRG
jgi:acyl-CoA reductase-like NAD-dependent aldehyde dehydrogenase